jgi:CRP-like cAMP-binding protein
MLSTVDKVLFFLRAPVTAEMGSDALSRLAQVASEVELPAGARVYGVGQDANALYLILEGAVRVEDGDGTHLSSAGDVVGGLALFAGAAHREAATVLGGARMLRLLRDDLFELLDEDGELARALFSGLLRAG